MITTKSLNLRDLCLLWGCPGVVFLTISMFVALKVGADFQQDRLAKWTAFLLCNLLLWLLYIMFQSVLVDLLPKKWNKQTLLPQIIEEEVPVESESVNSDTDVERISYAQRCKEYEQEQAQQRNEELEKLCEEIQKWTEDFTYKPVPVRLKQKLTTVDLRHFVWNIGERLGTKNGYNGYARADFIMQMFPTIFMDMSQDSTRNFKFQPNKGSILIDEPDKDDWHFHYE